MNERPPAPPAFHHRPAAAFALCGESRPAWPAAHGHLRTSILYFPAPEGVRRNHRTAVLTSNTRTHVRTRASQPVRNGAISIQVRTLLSASCIRWFVSSVYCRALFSLCGIPTSFFFFFFSMMMMMIIIISVRSVSRERGTIGRFSALKSTLDRNKRTPPSPHGWSPAGSVISCD